MKKNINLLKFTLFYVLLAMFSCSDDVADDVYHKSGTLTEVKKSSLTVILENADKEKNYIIGALAQNPFNEMGESEEITEQSFVFRKSVVNGQVIFENLMDYYKSTLFLNVFEEGEKGDSYNLISHLGNQLQFQVALGNNKKKIDLLIEPLELAKKSVMNITVDESYNNKILYLVKQDMQAAVEAKLQAGVELTKDMYIEKTISAEGKAQFSIYSPKNQTTYCVYLVMPLDKVPFLKQSLDISYETTAISCDFQKISHKVINVTAIYNKLPKAREIYLITEQNWTNVVKASVAQNQAPKSGTFVDMQTTTAEGMASFELFVPAKGQTKYVLYVPKWKGLSYADYKIENITISSDRDIYDIKIVEDEPEIPSSGKVTFNVTFASSLKLYGGNYNYVYAIEDSGDLKAGWNYALNGGAKPNGVYRSVVQVGSVAGTAIIENVPIDPTKEIAIFMVVQDGWAPSPAVLRIKGRDVKGNPCNVILNKIEKI